MSLSVGIVGLPNVGKSTLFNALLKRQVALAANYPFATIEPNVGVVGVSDERLEELAVVTKESEGMEKKPPIVSATITFKDIAGLVKGAHKGEGLGNQFLAHIREVDLICHVLRAFEDDEVIVTGKMDPKEDLAVVRAELILKDMETVQRAVDKAKGPVEAKRREFLQKLLDHLDKGKMANSLVVEEEWEEDLRELCLITLKPEIFAVNLSEEQLKDTAGLEYEKKLGVKSEDLVYINAKLESELSSLSQEDQALYLKDLGIEKSGIEQMSQVGYRKLNLISFLTAGVIEVRAWTIKNGTKAPEAAGVIHTDFLKKFIKAKVVSFEDFIKMGGWKKCAEMGKVRQEGRDYVIKDGEVVEFMIGS